jgi:predicted transposase/invertase (TIGR01784 family)
LKCEGETNPHQQAFILMVSNHVNHGQELTEMDSAIKRAEKKLEYLSSDEEALALYRAREDSVHERANLIYSGKMEGIEEGIEKGKIQIAQNMLAKNTPFDYIAEVTGLSLEEIKTLQSKIN